MRQNQTKTGDADGCFPQKFAIGIVLVFFPGKTTGGKQSSRITKTPPKKDLTSSFLILQGSRRVFAVSHGLFCKCGREESGKVKGNNEATDRRGDCEDSVGWMREHKHENGGAGG